MFSKNFFPVGTPKEKIIKAMKQDGFDPKLVNDPQGLVYEQHQHDDTKLLVCLQGSQKIKVLDKEYNFEPGDKLYIPSNTLHSGVVGPKGCLYYWSEKD